MHRKHVIDRSIEVTEGSRVCGEGIPDGVWGAPPPEKVITYFQHIIVLPLIFGIWFGVFPIGRAYLYGL